VTSKVKFYLHVAPSHQTMNNQRIQNRFSPRSTASLLMLMVQSDVNEN